MRAAQALQVKHEEIESQHSVSLHLIRPREKLEEVINMDTQLILCVFVCVGVVCRVCGVEPADRCLAQRQ